MSNLTSTAPAAYAEFLSLIATAAAEATPPVQVIDGVLLEYEPGTYIEMVGWDEHEFIPAGIGNFAFDETYELYGFVRVFTGASDDFADPRNAAMAAYQSCLVTPVIANKTLGLNASGNPLVLWIIPKTITFTQDVTDIGGAQAVIEFKFTVKARLYV